MNKIILTPQKAKEIQDEIYKKMTASQKMKLVNQFFEFGKKLNKLNDRLNGNNVAFIKNNRNFKKT